MGIAGAIAAAGVAAAGASVASGSLQAGAASQAGQDQLAATQESIAQQNKFFGIDKGLLQPFVNAGESAAGPLSNFLGITGNTAGQAPGVLGSLMGNEASGAINSGNLVQSLLGEGPGGAKGETAALASTPGYQFALQQGQQANNNAMTARGLGLSGAQLRGATNYAEGTAEQTYGTVLGNAEGAQNQFSSQYGANQNTYLSQLYNFLGLGENAAAGVGNSAIQTGQGIGNSAIQGGNAQAASLIGSAGALSSGITGVSNAIGGTTSGLTGYNLYQQLLAQNSGTTDFSSATSQPYTDSGLSTITPTLSY